MIHLSQSRSSIIFEEGDETLSILHWGKKVAPFNGDGEKALSAAVHKPHFHGGLDVAPRNLVLREHSRGFIGHPSLRGHRAGMAASNRFALTSATQRDQTLVATFFDYIAALEVELTYSLTPSDILHIDGKVTNKGSNDYFLEHFLYWLPLAEQADQVLDFYGHWTKERQPQRRDIAYGLTSREGFEGRSGHD